MSQLSYSIEHAVAYEGGRADSAPCDARAGLNVGAAEIPFGRFVALGTVPTNLGINAAFPMKNMDAAANVVLGVLLHDQAHELIAAENGTQVGQMGSILRKGRVYVHSEVAMNPGDPVFVRHTAGAGGSQIGRIRKDLDTNTAVQVAAAVVVGKCTAGSLVAIDLNLP